jgi:hypothetical protein
MIRILNRRRRRGQGMTEYIIVVGLIGILLVAAIFRFKETLRVTIEGSAGDLQKDANAISSGSGGPISPAPPKPKPKPAPPGYHYDTAGNLVKN